jgi:vacuolar-type H+-ATPase subunit F/Vma7
MGEKIGFYEEQAHSKKARVAEGGSAIAVVGEEALTKGFRLAGIGDIRNVLPETAQETLRALIKDPAVAIIITYDSVIDKCDFRTKKEIESMAKPVIVTLASREAAQGEGESLQSLIKRALGFDLFKQ